MGSSIPLFCISRYRSVLLLFFWIMIHKTSSNNSSFMAAPKNFFNSEIFSKNEFFHCGTYMMPGKHKEDVFNDDSFFE